MRTYCALMMFTLCAGLCHSQTAKTDQELLLEARGKYDAPFKRNLESFDCAIDFNWKDHFKETYRVGDEGTDEELQKVFQPIRNRVTVTHDDAVISSGMTEEQEHQLPHGGMAEGLLKHAVRFSLRTWLVASNDALIPAAGTLVRFESSPSVVKLNLKIQTFDVVMTLSPDMRLQSMAGKSSAADRQDFEFEPGPQGFLLKSWTMGENGDFKDGNHLIFDYGYQTVGGFQIPAQGVVDRESHHEVWHYKLSDCIVRTSK